MSTLQPQRVIILLATFLAAGLLAYMYVSTQYGPNIHQPKHYDQLHQPEADDQSQPEAVDHDQLQPEAGDHGQPDRDIEPRHPKEPRHREEYPNDAKPHQPEVVDHQLAVFMKPKTNVTKRKTEHRPTLATPHNFVLAESYWEEMTMATHNFMGLVTVAKHWNARAVWPFTAHSYLNGLKGPYTWDLLYDLDDVKQKCAEMSLPAPVRFEDFLKNASRRVISIIVDWKNDKGTNRCSELQEKDMKFKVNFLNAKLETVAHHLPRFRQEACCVVYNRPLVNGIVEIADKCGLKDRESFTALFKEWRGITYNKEHAYRVSVPHNNATEFPTHFNHSKWVIGNTTLFFNDITRGTTKCIAVHVRAEVLFRDNIIDKCLTNLNQISKSLRTNYTDLPLLVFGDEELHMPQSRIQNRISNGIFVHFIPKKYKAVADRGFTAQVEQHTMSLCQILVRVGGGSFQALTLARFNTEPSHLFSIRACGY